MNSSAPMLTQAIPPMTLPDRAATGLAWGVAVAAFMTIGWVALRPDDPLGPVSLLSRNGWAMMLVQAAALAAVTSGMATVLAGRKLAEVGVFAASLGMVGLSLRGGTIVPLLIRHADAIGESHRGLALTLAGASVGWTLVIAVSLVVSAVVDRMCFGAHAPGQPHADDDLRVLAARSLSVTDVPVVSELLTGFTPEHRTPWREGVRHTVINAVLALMLLKFMSSGLAARSTEHGQACFLVAGPMLLAAYSAHRMAPVRTPLWGLLAVLLMTLAGYAWSIVVGGSSEIASAPASSFLRILPIQYIAVGSASVVLMFWYMYVPGMRLSRATPEETPDRPITKPRSRKGRR